MASLAEFFVVSSCIVTLQLTTRVAVLDAALLVAAQLLGGLAGVGLLCLCVPDALSEPSSFPVLEGASNATRCSFR